LGKNKKKGKGRKVERSHHPLTEVFQKNVGVGLDVRGGKDAHQGKVANKREPVRRTLRTGVVC